MLQRKCIHWFSYGNLQLNFSGSKAMQLFQDSETSLLATPEGCGAHYSLHLWMIYLLSKSENWFAWFGH